MAANSLGLLDGVDAEVGLEVEVEVEHVGRVAGLLGDERQHALARPRRAAGAAAGATAGRRLPRPARAARRGLAAAPDGAARRGGVGRGCAGAAARAAGRLVAARAACGWTTSSSAPSVAADAAQPRLPRRRVGDAVREAELVGLAAAAVGRRAPSAAASC